MDDSNSAGSWPSGSVVPPVPPPAETIPSSWRLLRYYSTNALQAWPLSAYEDDVLVRPMFGRTSLLINRPEDIRRVLVENDGNYGRTRPTVRVIRPLLGDGLFLATGGAWKHQRRVLAPAFVPKATSSFACATAAALADALPELEERSAGADVDLLSWLQHLTLDVAGRALLSLPLRERGAALRQRILNYGQSHGRLGFFDFFLPLSIPSPRDLGRAWFKWRWFRLVDRLVCERLAWDKPVCDGGALNPFGSGHRDVFDLLRCARDPETGVPFTRRELRDQIATLIVAGHETTAVSLFWACYLVALDPVWQERLAAEAENLDLDAEDVAEALPRLPVTRAVVQEAMRLYPPAFVIVRLAKGADRLADITVEPGTVVMIAPWVLHRHKRLWPAPAVFDPARFLPGAPAAGRFAYLPFGAGPRVCIGAPLAMTEATIVLAALARRFRIRLSTDRPVLPVAVVTTQPEPVPPFCLEPVHRR